ncbi:MAG: response regulator transcription factor [Clostridia bacterium]|nr:response regulator transcription factor [Clostridia bacterium]
MRIAICDDEKKDLTHMYEMVTHYFETHSDMQTAEIDCFETAADIMNHLDYDIYILDILIGDDSGLKVAKTIRNVSGMKCEIIFTTSSSDFALAAFSVYARQYLLKPVKQQELENVLTTIIKNKEIPEKQSLFSVKTAEGMRELDTNKIICVEYTARIIHFHMQQGALIQSIYIRSSFEDSIKELLKLQNYMQTHKSFAINMDYVKEYHQGEILLQNGMLIPVSRSNAKTVKRQYLKYVSRNFAGGGNR